MVGATHVVYAALQESDDLTAGWHDRALMEQNLTMFSNALEPVLDAAGETLEHVSLLQGAKAYGLHVGRTIAPAKERTPRDDHDNFYFLQEDRLRELATGAPWSWTILRPQVVYGQSFGSPMNLVPVIGVYAALLHARGLPLSFPGGAPHIQEAVDARLLARALAWSATAPAAQGEVFNLTNGDVFNWHDVWPTVADALGMDVGDPEPMYLADVMPPAPTSGPTSSIATGCGRRATCTTSSAVRGATPTSCSVRSVRRARSRAAEHSEDPPRRLRRLHRHRGHAPRVAHRLPGAEAPAAAVRPVTAAAGRSIAPRAAADRIRRASYRARESCPPAATRSRRTACRDHDE